MSNELKLNTSKLKIAGKSSEIHSIINNSLCNARHGMVNMKVYPCIAKVEGIYLEDVFTITFVDHRSLPSLIGFIKFGVV